MNTVDRFADRFAWMRKESLDDLWEWYEDTFPFHHCSNWNSEHMKNAVREILRRMTKPNPDPEEPIEGETAIPERKTMQHQRNARFWAYVNDGFVKLTLTVARPSIEISTGGRHEEGWSRNYECWALSEQGVDRMHMSDGVDCDGRTSSTWRTFCAFDRLASFAPFDPADPMLPDWQEIKSWQRDYSAETMGY